MVKLDIGCGKHKKDGFIGIDRIKFDGVDVVCRVGVDRLPYDDSSVDEVYMSHFIEHLTRQERCQLLNELYRVMKTGAKATVIVPSWSSSRAYGDPTHEWPPIGEMWFNYLRKEYRESDAPHTDKQYLDWGYECDFDATWGHGIHPTLLTRNYEFQHFALNFYKEAAQDIHATLVKRGLSA